MGRRLSAPRIMAGGFHLRSPPGPTKVRRHWAERADARRLRMHAGAALRRIVRAAADSETYHRSGKPDSNHPLRGFHAGVHDYSRHGVMETRRDRSNGNQGLESLQDRHDRGAHIDFKGIQSDAMQTGSTRSLATPPFRVRSPLALRRWSRDANPESKPRRQTDVRRKKFQLSGHSARALFD